MTQSTKRFGEWFAVLIVPTVAEGSALTRIPEVLPSYNLLILEEQG